MTLTELWTLRSQDHLLLGAKDPSVELSLLGSSLPPWNFRTLERSFQVGLPVIAFVMYRAII